MSVSEARSRSAALQVLPWNDEVIGISVVRASATFVEVSPQVSPAAGAPGLWWIGATGDGDEERLADSLLERARVWHSGARVGVASSCVAARAATWAGGSGRSVIVPAGGCADYMSKAPLGMMTMDSELHESLLALGLRTIGQLARLPLEEVERRWGPAGISAWRLANGDDDRRPGLLRPETPRTVSTELSPSVSTTEPILFLLRAALERLLAGLIVDGRSVAVAAITLALDDVRNSLPVPTRTHTVTREIRLPRPLARIDPLFERCRALLEDWPLSAPVRAVNIAITATAPLSGAQGDLLDTSWRDPAAAEAALARLRSRLGSDVVVRPVLADSHRPEAAATWQRFDETAGDDMTRNNGLPGNPVIDDKLSTVPDARPAALRRLDPPEPVAVTITADRPQALRWRNRWVRVRRATGPERVSGEWWDDSYRRDYWRCENEETGASMVVFRDLAADSGDLWFLQGWYD